MIARALLLIAIFAGLLGGQVDARGVCGSAEVCADCCAPDSDVSCCASDQPEPPATAPVANPATDWKMVVQPIVTLLAKAPAAETGERHALLNEAPRASGLARIERTCARLI